MTGCQNKLSNASCPSSKCFRFSLAFPARPGQLFESVGGEPARGGNARKRLDSGRFIDALNTPGQPAPGPVVSG